MEILLLVTLVLINGAFAMSEIALVTARRSRLGRLADTGDRSAAAAMRLGEKPTRFLSTIQIGITSIGILNGIIGEAVLAAPLSEWLQTLGMDDEESAVAATGFVVVVITYVSIVIGELVPKRLGQFNPEGIARVVARPMEFLALLTRPFVSSLRYPRNRFSMFLEAKIKMGQELPRKKSMRCWRRDRSPVSSRSQSTRWCAMSFAWTNARSDL